MKILKFIPGNSRHMRTFSTFLLLAIAGTAALAAPSVYAVTRYYAGYVMLWCEGSCNIAYVEGVAAEIDIPSQSIMVGQGLSYWVALAWDNGDGSTGWLQAGYSLGETPAGYFASPVISAEWNTPTAGYNFVVVSQASFGSRHTFRVWRDSESGGGGNGRGNIEIDGTVRFRPSICTICFSNRGQALAHMEAFQDSTTQASGHWSNLEWEKAGSWHGWDYGTCPWLCSSYAVVQDSPYAVADLSRTEFVAGYGGGGVGGGGGGCPNCPKMM